MRTEAHGRSAPRADVTRYEGRELTPVAIVSGPPCERLERRLFLTADLLVGNGAVTAVHHGGDVDAGRFTAHIHPKSGDGMGEDWDTNLPGNKPGDARSYWSGLELDPTSVITPPTTPVNASPSDSPTADNGWSDLVTTDASAATVVGVAPTLVAGGFRGPSGGSHVASQWVVARTSDGAEVFDSGEDSANLTRITLPPLDYDTAYTWKVRYKSSSGAWSAYSVPTAFTTQFEQLSLGSNGGTATIKMDADRLHLDVTINGTTLQFLASESSPFTLLGGAGDDTITVDFSNGNPVPLGGIVVTGGGGNDTLVVIGTPGDDLVAGSRADVEFIHDTIDAEIFVNNVHALRFDGGGGHDTLNLGGAWQLDANSVGGLSDATLNVVGNGSVTLPSSLSLGALNAGNGQVSLGSATVTLTLSEPLEIDDGGTLDLGRGTLIAPTSPDIATYVARAAGPVGSNGLNGWTGSGLTSGVVQADAANGNAKQLAVGFFDSRDNGQTGLSVPAGQTLVKVTVYGDATGDGRVSIADLSVWNNNFGVNYPRWSQGDFNYDGKVNIADLSVWNNDFGNTIKSSGGSAAAPAVLTVSAPSATAAPPRRRRQVYES